MFADGAEASWGNEHFRSPNDLVISSDLVFVGTVTGARWLGQDSRGGHFPARLHALAYDVHVGKLISTTPFHAEDRQVTLVLALRASRRWLHPPIGDKAVFFVRRLGRSGELYRPTSTLGVLDVDRGRLGFVLGGHAPWTSELTDQTFREAVAYLAYFTPHYPY